MVPFAEKIRFGSQKNRRNPVIFIDLVNAHAALFRFQREINGDSGAQATILTRNEAAALKTVAKAGLAEFIVRRLQQMLGCPNTRPNGC